VRLAADLAGDVDHVLGLVAAEEEPAEDAGAFSSFGGTSSCANTIQAPATSKSLPSACSTPFT